MLFFLPFCVPFFFKVRQICIVFMFFFFFEFCWKGGLRKILHSASGFQKNFFFIFYFYHFIYLFIFIFNFTRFIFHFISYFF